MTNIYKDWRERFEDFCKDKIYLRVNYKTQTDEINWQFITSFIEQIIEGERADILRRVEEIGFTGNAAGHYAILDVIKGRQTNSLQEGV